MLFKRMNGLSNRWLLSRFALFGVDDDCLFSYAHYLMDHESGFQDKHGHQIQLLLVHCPNVIYACTVNPHSTQLQIMVEFLPQTAPPILDRSLVERVIGSFSNLLFLAHTRGNLATGSMFRKTKNFHLKLKILQPQKFPVCEEPIFKHTVNSICMLLNRW